MDREARIAEVNALRDQAESADKAERCEAVVALIAKGFYLAYSDARHAAQLAISGAHARSA